MTKDLIQKLNKIQKELKAPKNQRNDFANFNYRSAEDILEAVKPLLGDNLIIIMNEEIINVGQHNYIHCTATLTDGTASIKASTDVKEPTEPKPKMDASQTSGSSISYARKYALGGLLALNDEKDADGYNNTKPGASTYQPKANQQFKDDDGKDWITDEQFKNAIKTLMEAGTINTESTSQEVMKLLRTRYKVAKKYEPMVEEEIKNALFN
jgi:hypothetical protein